MSDITPLDTEKLMRFVARVMIEHRNDGYAGDLDGGELQDMAESCGLIAPQQMVAPCDGQNCVCAEISEFPLTCYRDTALLRKCYALERLPVAPAASGEEPR